MGIVSILTIFTIDGRRIRNQEATDSLRSAIESTMQNLKDVTYDIDNNQMFIADFIQALAIQIESDSTIQVNVQDVDYEKGLLSIEVIEHFTHPNGKPGTVSCVRSVILEQKETTDSTSDTEQVTIIYRYPDNSIYKQFNIVKGSEIIIPKDPSMNGKTFTGWMLNGTTYNCYAADGSKKKVTDSLSLIAILN